MHYTSGTTGKPKGVTTGLWDEATARAVFEDEAEVWHFDPDDLHMVCSPMYHTAVGPLRRLHPAGGRVAGRPGPLRRRHRPRYAPPPPTHHRLHGADPPRAHPAVPRPRDDERFDSLRLLAHAGAPCPEPVKRAVMARAGPARVWEFYGSTEAQFTVCPPEDWLEHPGTVGRARPGRSIEPVRHRRRASRASTAESGTIWCDMPDVRPLQLLGRPRRHRRRLARVGLHRRRPRPPRSRRLPLPDRPAPRPHHQRRRQRLPRRGRERPGRRRRHRRGGRLRPARRAVGPAGLRRLRRRGPRRRRPPRRPCGPPRRPSSPRTSGPRRTSPPRTCPTRPPGS